MAFVKTTRGCTEGLLCSSLTQVPGNTFEVKCVPPGYWDAGFTWAYCDVASPPQCDDFSFEAASGLAAKGISIVDRKNVGLGGKAS